MKCRATAAGSKLTHYQLVCSLCKSVGPFVLTRKPHLSDCFNPILERINSLRFLKIAILDPDAKSRTAIDELIRSVNPPNEFVTLGNIQA